jgi:hypothetical protein
MQEEYCQVEVKLSPLEKELLLRAGSSHQSTLSAMFLTPAEKSGCKRLVKKGLMDNIMDTFYAASQSPRPKGRGL